jgi:putative phosphoribosyl transferase
VDRGTDRSLGIAVAGATLEGDLVVPEAALGVVLFAHGSGSGRHSPRNRFVAQGLQAAGLATLLIDLLTLEEERVDERTRQLRFDIPLLAARLAGALEGLREEPDTRDLPVGLFGASTGAGAALVAAAGRDDVRAVVSRGGRPDLAGEALRDVTAKVLLIVGGHDRTVIDLNEAALGRLPPDARLEVVPGAGHLFEEPGALDEVVRLARDWFATHLPAAA